MKGHHVGMEIRGSVALVTGAAAETGRTIAARLAALGAAVAVADRDREAGDATARAIAAEHGRARCVAADVTKPGDVRRMLAFAEEELGGQQVLVDNAGGGGHIEPHFPDAEPADRPTLALNLTGAVLARSSRSRRCAAPGAAPS